MKKFILLLLIIICQDAFATEYYVSTNGNDNNDGKSESKAWRTIGHAASNAVAGDIVWIKAGNYGREIVRFRKDGKKNKPISFLGYKKKKGDIKSMYFKYAKGKSLDASKMPLLDGKNRADGSGLKLSERSYIVIKNIQITNYKHSVSAWSGANNLILENMIASNSGGTSKYLPINSGSGFRLDALDNHHNIIRNCIVLNSNQSAIVSYGDHNLIQNCKTYADQDDVNDDGRSMDYHVVLRGSNNIIRGHYAEHVGDLAHTGHGLVMKSGDTKTENNLIEDCDIVNVNGSIEFRHRAVKYNTVRNIRIKGTTSRYAGGFQFRDGASFNTVENSYVKNLRGANGGISFYDTVEDGGTQWSGNDNIVKNTIFENCDLGIRLGTNNRPSNAYNNKILNCTFYDVENILGFWPKSKNKNNIIQNCNISKSKLQFYKNVVESGWTESYNNYFETDFGKPKGTGNISVEPLFVNASKGNFKLKSGSKLINKGKKVTEVKKDFDGKKRPKGSSHDIGAFEYQGKTVTTVKAEVSEDQVICKGDKVVLNAEGGDKFAWSNGEKTSSITVTPDKTTIYKVKVSTGGSSDEAEVTITVKEVKAYAGKNVTITKGEEVNLKASGGDTYLWNTGETTQDITVSPDKSKTYSVTVTSGDCEDVDKVTVKVEANLPPVVASISEDLSICKGDEIVLKASGGTDYSWSNGKTTSEIKVSPDKTTTYKVTVSDGVTKDDAELTITVKEVKAYAGKSVTITKGEEVTLKGTGGDTYAWNTGDKTQSITVSPDKTTTYAVTAFANGCEDIDKVTVTVEANLPPVVASISEDLSICKGDEIVLKASGGTEYSWNNGKTASEIKVSPDKTTTYKVTVSDGVTEDDAEVTITVNEVKAYAGKSVTIARGEEVTLNGTGGDTYSWNTGDKTQSITVSPDKTTTYAVTAFANGCEDIDKVMVIIDGDLAPVVAAVSEDLVICKGDEIILKASGGTEYSWNNGKTTSEIKVSPDKTTTYKVTVSDGVTEDDAEVTITVNEVKAYAGKSVTIARGEEVTLNGTGGDTYSWNTGDKTQSITVSPDKTTTYAVTAFANGCEDIDKVMVIIDGDLAPVVAEVSEDLVICKGDEIVLKASGGTEYSWNNGKTTSEIKVSPDKTTTYKVTVSDGVTEDDAAVTITVNEVKAYAGKSVTIARGEEVTLNGTGGDTYSWNTGDKTQSITVSPDKTTTYAVTAFANGCEDIDKVMVIIDGDLPPVVAEVSEDLVICKGDEIILKASGGTEYSWNNGKTTSEIKVSPDKTTTYKVTVSDGVTEDDAEVTITVNEVKAYAGKSVTIARGEEVTLNGTGGDTYSWNTGDKTQSITVSPDKTTTYAVTAFANGCEDIDKVMVIIDGDLPPVVAVITEDLTICKGDEIVLKASGGTEYSWNNGKTTSEIKVSPDKTTTYKVTVSDGVTEDDAAVTITVNEVKAYAGEDISIDAGEEVTLIATGGESYQWNNGLTTASIKVSPETTTSYTVTVSQNGCEATDKVKVIVNNSVILPVVAEVSDDLAICKGDEIVLKASGGTDYSWSNGNSTSEIKVNPDKTTTYKVTVSDGITEDEAAVTVTVNEVQANAGADMSIKKGESVKLTASGGDLFQWNNGEVSKSIIVSPSLSTEYEVRVERNGCVDFDTVKVFVSSLENSHLTASAGADVTTCAGENVTLTASGGSNYKWNNGETSKSISVNPNITTIYSVEVSEGTRSVKDEVIVFVDNVEADAGNNVTIIEDESITLSAKGGERFEWSNGENTQSITISPKDTQIYTVTVFKNDCRDTDSVQVTVNKRIDLDELPPIAQAGENQNICLGESVTLMAKGQGDFLWSTGDEIRAIKVSPKRTTTYLLSATNGNTTVTDEVIVYVENCLNDRDDVADLALVVYPNPSDGIMTLNIDNVSNDLKLAVFDLNGRIIHSENINAKHDNFNKQLDLSRFPKGVYLVKLYNQYTNLTKKVLLI